VSVEDGWTIYLSSTVKRWLEWDVTCFPFGLILHVVHNTRMQPGGITRKPSDGVSGLCLFIVPTSEGFWLSVNPSGPYSGHVRLSFSHLPTRVPSQMEQDKRGWVGALVVKFGTPGTHGRVCRCSLLPLPYGILGQQSSPLG